MLLDVGMVIYSNGGLGKYLQRYVITRVTPKLAYVKINAAFEMKFDREVEPKYFYRKDRVRFDTVRYWIEDEETKLLYYKLELVGELKKFEFTDLPLGKLERIMAIMKE